MNVGSPGVTHVTYAQYPNSAELLHKGTARGSRRTRLAGVLLLVLLAAGVIWLLS